MANWKLTTWGKITLAMPFFVALIALQPIRNQIFAHRHEIFMYCVPGIGGIMFILIMNLRRIFLYLYSRFQRYKHKDLFEEAKRLSMKINEANHYCWWNRIAVCEIPYDKITMLPKHDFEIVKVEPRQSRIKKFLAPFKNYDPDTWNQENAKEYVLKAKRWLGEYEKSRGTILANELGIM